MLLNQEQKKICQKAIDYFDTEDRNKKTVEELSELIKELIKPRKDKNLRRLNVIDEIADTLILLQQQLMILEISKKEMSSRICYKLDRLDKLIKNGEVI